MRSRSGAIAGRGGRHPVDPNVRPLPAQRNRHRRLKIALITVFALLVLVAIGVYAFWQSLMSNVEIIPTNEETVPSEYNIPTASLSNPVPQEKGIQNILLLGVDSREEGNLRPNSDTMMILTVDEINKKIKLTSLQRDMLVYEPGKEDPVKLNAVNAHGGPMLTMRVVNETFRLDIKHYVLVS
jgi:anionic cell wall polymer biosynthesis LytR-Cps2A-Psr (LCP) family protein